MSKLRIDFLGVSPSDLSKTGAEAENSASTQGREVSPVAKSKSSVTIIRMRLSRKIAYLTISLVIGGVFSWTLTGGFVWDDQQFVVENIFLSSFRSLPNLFTQNLVAGAGLVSNLYRPIELVTHFLDREIWGLEPLGHHLTNLLLAILAGLSLYVLLEKLFPRKSTLASLLGTLLFCLHPLQALSVGYISGRSDLLLLICTLQAAFWYEKSVLLAIVFSALGVLSKESGAMIPIFVLGIHWSKQTNFTLRKGLDRKALALAIVPALYVLARLTVLNFNNILNFYGEENILSRSLEYRIYTYLSTIPKALQLWFWPYDLHPERSWGVHIDPYDPSVMGGFFLILVAGFLVFHLRKRAPLAAFGVLWFFLATLPTSNIFFLINAIFYDHWMIYPGLGLVLIATSILSEIERPRTFSVVGVVLVLFATITIPLSRIWHDGMSLNSFIVQYEPRSMKAIHNLAMAYSDAGDLARAEALYLRALELEEGRPEIHHNLGKLFQAQGKYSEAILRCERALALDPRFFQAHTLLGEIYLSMGEKQKALEEFEASLRVHPSERAQKGIEDTR